MSVYVFPKSVDEMLLALDLDPTASVTITKDVIVEMCQRLAAVEALAARLAELAGGPR